MGLPAVFLVQIVCFAGRKYNVCWQDGTPQQRNYSQMQMWSLGTGALALIVRFFYRFFYPHSIVYSTFFQYHIVSLSM
jgi:hypothetical protein